jgi:hypothetical protein
VGDIFSLTKLITTHLYYIKDERSKYADHFVTLKNKNIKSLSTTIHNGKLCRAKTMLRSLDEFSQYKTICATVDLSLAAAARQFRVVRYKLLCS